MNKQEIFRRQFASTTAEIRKAMAAHSDDSFTQEVNRVAGHLVSIVQDAGIPAEAAAHTLYALYSGFLAPLAYTLLQRVMRHAPTGPDAAVEYLMDNMSDSRQADMRIHIADITAVVNATTAALNDLANINN